MFKKLKNKLLITTMVMITVFVFLCLVETQIAIYHSIKTDIGMRLDNAVKIAEKTFSGRDRQKPPGSRYVPAENKGFATELAVYCDKDGNILDAASGLAPGGNAKEVLADIVRSGSTGGSTSFDDAAWAYKLVEYEDGYIAVFTKKDLESRMMLTLVILLGSASLVSLGISFMVSRLISDRAIRPVEEAYEKQRRFVSDASHELRTPLASISANLDVLLAGSESMDKEEIKWLRYVKDETARMTQLTNDLLYLARADEGRTIDRESMPTISLSDICGDVLIENDAVAFEKGVMLDYDLEEDINVVAPPGGLKQLVLILVDNAIKYTPDKGNIYARLARENGKAVFYVENDGDIDSEDLPHLFERFYRADSSRVRESGGYGLGLSIAESICAGLNAEIKAESGNGRVRFTVTIQEKTGK